MAKKKEKKPSSNYWKKRFSDLENAQNQYGQQTFHQIEPSFDKAQAQIQSQIESWYQRYATNNGISMAEARKQLSAAELKELKWDVQEYIKYGQENAIDQRWMTELENASARFHISRLEALKLRSQQALEVAFGNEKDSLDSMLKQMYQSGYYHTCFEVQKGFNIGWEIGQIDEKKLQKVISRPWATDGKTFSDRVWNSKTQMVGNLHQQLTRTIIQGKAPDEAIRTMTKYLKDKTKNAKYQAGRLVMTESAFISSAAQKDAFNELDVEEFEIVATLDSRTSEICQEMDGQHFPMKDFEPGVTAPPFHVYCRSTTVPYFNDEWSGGERAARGEDGKTYYVPSDMKYPEWKESLVGGDTSDLQEVVPEIKFSTKPNSSITNKEKFEDTLTATSAFSELPLKVKQNLNDVIFEFGYDGSACDILNKTIRVGIGASKEEIFHECGHLIENYMMKASEVKKYKEFLVDGLSYNDIIIETYYDSVGNGVDIFLLNSNKFESEYQSRLYVSNIMEALNSDGTINVDVLGETISEPFRKYMVGEDVSDEVKKLIEGVVL